MRNAMMDAGVTAEQVVYVNAHGTGTAQNDVSEARGIEQVLGASTPFTYVGSTKSMMGHLVAACGVVEALVALQAVTDGVAPPQRNLDSPDPECNIRHVHEAPTPLPPVLRSQTRLASVAQTRHLLWPQHNERCRHRNWCV